jgi:hypothetical protein
LFDELDQLADAIVEYEEVTYPDLLEEKSK